jgi:hypothetical protein
MSSRSLSLGWCVALSALVVGLTTACGGGTPQPPPPPPVKAQPDAGKSTVVVNRGSGVLANGRDSVTITVTVRDESGAAMADRTVTLEVSGDGNTVTPASGKTGGDGVLAATLVSTRPGVKQVTASVATDGAPVVLSARPTVEFVALQASKVGFTTTSIQATAGATLPVIEVALQDADGATVRGATSAVTLVLASGPAAAELAGTLTVNAVDGVARFSDLRINKAGSGYSLRATSGSLGAATSVTFDVVPAAASVVELTGLPASMVAGETASASVLLKDAFGNVATNYGGTLRFSSSDNTAVLPADATFTAADAGQKSFPALSLRRAGTQRVTVTDVANAAVTASVDVQVLAADASRLVFSRQPDTRSVRETFGAVQVTLTDAYGNLAAVGSPTVTLALSSGTVTLNGTRVVAPVDGVASFTTLSIDQEGTGYTLTATAGTLTSATSAAFDIIDNVPPARPVLSQGTTGPTSIVVQWTAVGDDGTLGTASSQELRYSSSNIVTDADFSAATLVTTGAPKPAGGAESATLTGLAPGTNYYVALRVADSAGNAVRSATLPVSTPNPTVTQLAFITQPINGTAGTALPDVRVALQDANGDTVTSATSAVTLNLLNGPAFTPVTVTAVGGVATFSGLRVDTAGSGYRFRATSGSLAAVQSNPFSIQAGPATRLDMVGLVAPVISGQPGTVQVTAMDDYGNVATGYTGTVRFSSTDETATLPGDYTFTAADAGRRVFTNAVVLRTSGPVTVTVTDTDNAALTDSLSVTVDSGVAEQLVLTVPAAPVTAGGDFPVTVTLRDGAGNIASGYRGTVTFTSTDANAVLPGNYTFTAADAGQKTFSSVQLRTAGTRSITARDTGTATLTDTAEVTVNPAAVTALAFSAPATATAGDPFSVTVSAVDAFANAVPSYRGTVQFSSGDAQATLPGDYTFTAADEGSRMFSVTLASAGSRSVTVTDGTRSATATVEVSAGTAQSLTLTAPASATAGSNFNVTVRALDAFNNVVTGYTGTVLFSSDDAQASLPADYTFTAADMGQKTFSVQLRTAGSRTVSVTDGNYNASATVAVSPGPTTALEISAPAGSAAGSQFGITVRAVDAFGNATRGYRGTVQFSSNAAQATLPGNYTFTAADAGSRMFNVTLISAGSRTVTVTDGTRSATATVEVSAGAAQSLTLTAPANATAGNNFNVTVRALDAFNNVATGYMGTVQFTSTDAAAVLPDSYTFTASDAGTATFPVQLRTAGSRTVSVTDTVNGGLTATATVTVVANSPSQLVFIQQPANGTVRTTLAQVRVALRDDYGNDTNVSLPQVTLGLMGGNASAVLSGTLTRNPSAGVASFDNLSIDQEGTGFQLTAFATGLTGATSAPFTIVDNINPGTALITATPASMTSINVAWLAVGDDGNLGTAAEYDLRYSTSPINNETDFGNATRFVIPSPQAPNTPESATITGVNLAVTHYVALKVLDGAGNFSRSASVQVQGDACAGVVCTPPPATCSADGTSTVTYVSACQPATGTCQDTSTTTRCQAFETCSAGACVPVTPGSQGGEVIISEFSALGAEFIELHNPTAASINVAGYTLRNAAGMMADIRAVTDPNGTAATPVTIAAGGSVYGIPNPAGAIPGGVGFVYGASGTTFSLADTGDALALYKAAPAGTLQDAVDFRSFVTNPNTPLVAANFVGFAGNSTQLEPTTLTAAGNDTATNWCVSFYGAGVRGSRITNTAGAANGSCKVAVINEVLVDASGGDDGKAFIEIAGPGGSVIGGAKLTDVEGKGASAGMLNTTPAMGEVTLPTGVRIPADGILLVADGFGTTTNTLVPNFVANVDVRIANLDPENNGGDAIQLFMPGTPNVLLDTVGTDLITSTAGNPLDTNVAISNGLPMYEGGTALAIGPGANVAASMMRSPTSTDSNNNRNDFRWDPSPTPGLPNDTVNLTVTSITPDDVPNTVGSTTITVTGTDFGPLTAKFGANPVGNCTVTSNTQATCTAAGSASPSRVSVVFSNGVAVGVPDVTLAGGFTYTGNYNESNDMLEADYCNLQFPASFPVQAGQMTPLIYGRIYEAGVTEAGGAPAGVVAEVGYGPTTADPRSMNTWRFFQASYNTQTGNDDEFQGSFVAPAAGSYSYTYRFSFDNGVRWTYCDLNGAGSGPGLTFETAQLGAMTVNP